MRRASPFMKLCMVSMCQASIHLSAMSCNLFVHAYVLWTTCSHHITFIAHYHATPFHDTHPMPHMQSSTHAMCRHVTPELGNTRLSICSCCVHCIVCLLVSCYLMWLSHCQPVLCWLLTAHLYWLLTMMLSLFLLFVYRMWKPSMTLNQVSICKLRALNIMCAHILLPHSAIPPCQKQVKQLLMHFVPVCATKLYPWPWTLKMQSA